MGNEIVSTEDALTLKKKVERLISASRVSPDQIISTGRNITGCTLLTPGSNEPGMSTYPAFWIRDPAWIAESGMVQVEEVKGWLTLMIKTMQGHEPRYLQSGGVILPYSIADHVNVDGSPVFYPGTYRADETQGPPFGYFPPHDDQYWMSLSVYAYAKLAGNGIFQEIFASPMGSLPIWQLSELTHNAYPVDAASQLCVASDNITQHIVDWGYNDTITKTGKLLFPSLLRFESAIKLAHLFTHAGMNEQATTYHQQSELLRRSIIKTFYNEDERHEGSLFSATGIGHKPDVWGTAYAVYLGLLPNELALAAARWLLRSYVDHETVLHGQIRHLRVSDGFWELAQCQPGTYQNGGYWGYATGWYVYALSLVDRSNARQLFSEYLKYLCETWDDTLRSGAWECINPGMNHYQNPGYLATVALPYVVLKNKGIIE